MNILLVAALMALTSETIAASANLVLLGSVVHEDGTDLAAIRVELTDEAHFSLGASGSLDIAVSIRVESRTQDGISAAISTSYESDGDKGSRSGGGNFLRFGEQTRVDLGGIGHASIVVCEVSRAERCALR